MMDNSNNTLFGEKSNFSSQINKLSMTFINPYYEDQYKKFRYEEKNLLVAIGMCTIFSTLIMAIRITQYGINNIFNLTPAQLSPSITFSTAAIIDIGFLIELIIFPFPKLHIFRGFCLVICPTMMIVIYSVYYMNEIYKIANPLFIPITTMSIPVSVIVCLLYAYNWICGALQVFIMIALYEFDICYVPWSWALDKSMFIGLGCSTCTLLILAIYYLEYFHRKIIYLKIVAEQERNNMKSTMDKLPAPIIISTEGKIAYTNESFSKIGQNKEEEKSILALNSNGEDLKVQDINQSPQDSNRGQLNAIPDYENNEIETKLEKFSSANNQVTLKNIISEGKSVIEEEFFTTMNNEVSSNFSVSSLKITTIDKICNLYIMKNLTEIYKIKELKEREKFQRVYVASLTHDFRSPINIIMGYAEVLMEIINDIDIKNKYIKNIYNASSILAFLVQDVLDYSQLKSGTLDIAISQFSLEKEFRIIFSLYEEKFNSKGLYLNIEIKENVPQIIVNDANRVKQVLMNLLANAFKFTRKGGVRINVFPDFKNNLIITEVIDSGIGMTELELNKLFQEYGKIDRHKDLNPMGIGLGLFICKQLVHKMGGSIKVESQINQGSVFTFSFLIITSEKEIIIPTNNVEDNKNQINSCERFDSETSFLNHLKPKSFEPPRSLSIIDLKIFNCINCPKVLIVDDDCNLRSVIQIYCERNLIKSDDAENGLMALDKVNDRILSSCCIAYQVIFIDYHMPEMNGLEASLKIKQLLERKLTYISKIILVSGLSREEKREISLLKDNPFTSIENKPLSYERFKEIMKEEIKFCNSSC